MQWCLRFHRTGDHPRQTTHFRLHAGGRHQHLGASTGQYGIHVKQIDAITERQIGGFQRRCGLAYRMRFAGQRRLDHFQGVCRQQSAIGGNAVARFQQDDIAGNQKTGINFDNLFIAPNPGARRQHTLQSGQCSFRPMFLIKAQAGVEQHHTNDYHGILQVADNPGQCRREQQDDDQNILELINEFEPLRARLNLGQPIFAVALQPVLRLLTAQASHRVGAQNGNRGGNVEAMPGLFIRA